MSFVGLLLPTPIGAVNLICDKLVLVIKQWLADLSASTGEPRFVG